MDTPLLATILLASGAFVSIVFSFTKSTVIEKRVPFYFTVIILSATLGFMVYSLTPFTTLTSSSSLFRNDNLATFFGITVIVVSIFVAVSSRDYMENNPNIPVYNSLLLFSTLGMTLLAYSVDLLMIIVAWELMSLPTYILVGFRKKDPYSNEAAVKYFILGAFSSGILLYAISLTYGLTGTTNLAQILRIFGTQFSVHYPLTLLAVGLFVAGFGLKMSIVPFHMWIPDVYEGAPTTISTFLSAGTKKAGFVVAIRVFVVALPFFSINWTAAFAILALATMTWGNIAALTQRVLTRMLAYSSIAQAGYMLIGLAVATGPVKTLALTGILFHVLNHAIMQSSAFLAVAAVDYKTSKVSLESYTGLWRRMPITSFCLAVALLALAGIPPLNGFWSKLILFTAAIEGQMVWLAIAGVLNSALSLGYYAWVIKKMYIDESEEQVSSFKVKEPKAIAIVLILATLLIFIIGVYPSPIYEFAKNAISGI